MTRQALAGIVVCVTGLGICGCPVAQPPKTQVPLEQLLAEYNRNAAAIPRLWARAKMEITLPTEKGGTFTWGSVSSLATSNGLLILFKSENRQGPQDFVLIGRETGQELFRLGSSTSQDSYYLWYKYGEHSGLYHGRNDLAGAPGAAGIPLDPNQLLSVLGVMELPGCTGSLPMSVLTMQDAAPPYAYVVNVIARQPITGKALLRREMYFNWDDTNLRRPYRVDLLDERGRVVMTARLKDFAPIADAGPDAPTMPTNIAIDWPQKNSRIRMVLSEMTAKEKALREAADLVNPGIPPDRVVDVDKPTGGAAP